MSVLPKNTYRFNAIHMESQGTLNSPNKFEKEEKVRGVILPDLKITAKLQ